MARMLSVVLAAALAVVLVSAAAAQSRSIRGEIVHLQCSIEKGEAGRGAAHAACAMRCAREGQPMALLADDDLYAIEGDYTANKNAKLLDFVAKRVEAKGSVSERDGRKILNVSAMAVLK